MKLDVCDLCMKFVNKHDDYFKDSKECETKEDWAEVGNILEGYRILMKKILRHEFSVTNAEAQDRIIYGLGDGNWKHLWETEEEQKQSVKIIVKDLLAEIFYCSDRWTWDRMLRTNWIYIRLRKIYENRKGGNQ